MKYPYIGKCEGNNLIVMFTKKDICTPLDVAFTNVVKHQQRELDEMDFTNITREYLANTYGKVESKEHAEFIVKLAENAGFNCEHFNLPNHLYFSIGDKILNFVIRESKAKNHGEKPITIPLPPKEPEPKEWPQVGDEVVYDGSSDRFKSIKGEVVEVIARYFFEGNFYITINHHERGVFAMVVGDWLKKPLTPEEYLKEQLFQHSGARARDGGREIASYLAKAIINGEIKGLSYNPS